MRHAISLRRARPKADRSGASGKRNRQLMALTRNFKKTIVDRIDRESAFAQALLDEADNLFLSDEPETARVILRDLVNSRLGFEARNEN
jgi:hypothetical protein